jgi:hypothetical protein
MLTPAAEAAKRIRALVSGLPGDHARFRQLLMLQAYMDASGTGDPNAMVMAGFIADADTWGAFSTEWKTRLDHAGLTRFKMNEMAQSHADIEIAGYFYRTVEEFDIRAAVSCVIYTSDLVKIIRESSLPTIAKEKLQNPYYLAFKAVIEQVARHQFLMRMTEPIDFIFDNQSEKGALIDSWELFKFAASSRIRPLLGDTPAFRNDETVMPLQAADLYAWWVLKWHREGDANAGVRDLKFSWPAQRKINRFHMEYSEPVLRAGFEGILERSEILRVEAKLGRRGIVQEMREGLARIDFEAVTNHVGAIPDFYNDANTPVDFDEETFAAYEKDPGNAQIFIQNRDGVAFAASALLNYYMQTSGTTLRNHIPNNEAAKAIREGQCTFTVSFPITFDRNCFHMKTKQGPLDLKQLVFQIEFLLAPKVQDR